MGSASPAAYRPRVQRVLDVVGTVAAALLAFTAVPVVLVVVVGDPLSGGLGHAWAAGPRDALCVATVAAWIAWASCCAQLLRAVVAHVRGGEIRIGMSVLDLLASRIAVGVLALSSVGVAGPVALSASAGATVPANQPIALTARAATAAPAVSEVRAPAHRIVAAPTVRTESYAVGPGDTLWRIAQDRLDDGADWTALAALNLGHDMGQGERFVDPDHIRQGWRLRVFEGSPRRRDREASGTSGGTRPDHLPELVVLGMGSLACAALARRARRGNPSGPFRGELDLVGSASDGAVDAAALLHRFDGVPALEAFETANRMLGRARGGQPGGPAVRAITVGPVGVTFWLAGAPESNDEPPEGFEFVEGGTGWRVAHDRLARAEAAEPYVPIALPIGDDDDGTWLVALGPGLVLPLLGSEAHALVRSVRTAAGAWAWGDSVLVTDEAADPAFLSEAAADPRLARHLLFFGDPGALPPLVAARTAVVTTASVPASDLTVLVDRHGATIHPLSRVVRPHLQSVESARNVAQLLAPPVLPVPPVRHGARPEPPSPPVGQPGGTAAVVPGQVDVRLLTMSPRLDGLAEALPANRARPRRRARGVSRPAPARRDHQRSSPHPRARVVRCRRCRQDAVQHRVRGAAGHGSRPAR